MITTEQMNVIGSELTRIGATLKLSDVQKTQLKTFLTEAYEKVQDYVAKNPNISKEEVAKRVAGIRVSARDRLETFLSKEQLAKWDSEISKSKEFLGQKIAA